ncbi:glycoside hydrolase family 16 protein [Myriangium duriaei CBS 260.36]|uniref:Glycoside hydrolase family 16 protein n=1 Tax=Myriangium duriaei CBS 260.36 TaxID=1168546 RepID=A0A9P4MCN1_9PEZI|nr:glycoside hydrolase family 16 protein [Myriangium duriaei CBS 260.36]
MSLQIAVPALIWLSLISTVLSACSCGYSLSPTEAPAPKHRRSVVNPYTFTEALETDFLHVYTLPTYATSNQARIDVFGWQAQAYNVSPVVARGPYGKAAEIQNVQVNPLRSVWDWGGDGTGGGDPGLQMWVRSKNDVVDGASQQEQFVKTAELAAVRNDMLFGSYRIGMKMPAQAGTCTAFFWYRNDTSEVDLEFLSREVNLTNSSYPAPLNLVLQTLESAQQGYDASKTPYFKVQPLPFVPSAGYHEYRFDWLPDRVTFFADSVPLFTITEQAVIPKDPGHLIINHWSNGDPGWLAYFNSSDPQRQKHFTTQCKPGAQVCAIPDHDFVNGIDPSGSNGNVTGRTPFLTQKPGWDASESNPKNHDGEEGGAGGRDWPLRLLRSSITTVAVVALLVWT